MSNYSSFLISKEINTVPLKKNARFKIALIYPNTYRVGMSNLGFHSVYYQLNQHEDALCERFFYEPAKRQLLSLGNSTSLKSFDIIAFSISYELDYLSFFNILESIELLTPNGQRPVMPLIIVGGIVTSFNALALSKFSDVVFTGEAEESLQDFMQILASYSQIDSQKKKQKLLIELAEIKGIFVPEYSNPDRTEVSFVKDVNLYPTSTRIFTARTEFPNTFLTEVSRGCPWHCRFCATGSVYNRFRPRKLDVLTSEIDFGLRYTLKVGLVGAAISDYPDIEQLVEWLMRKNARISVSSLRIESVNPVLLRALADTGQRTVTFAPEAGSERLRGYLNKKISNAEILEKIELAKKCGIKKVKLYFMIGLPTEEDNDVEAIVELAKHAVGILPIKVHIGIFVPKPKTSFSREKIAGKKILLSKIRYLRQHLAAKKSIEFNARKVKEAVQEALFSTADEHFFKEFLRL
ncbi:MAG: radical SAM protein [PVC group bacterium]|nr:radical SAM protein [PVC group bacterium]